MDLRLKCEQLFRCLAIENLGQTISDYELWNKDYIFRIEDYQLKITNFEGKIKNQGFSLGMEWWRIEGGRVKSKD